MDINPVVKQMDMSVERDDFILEFIKLFTAIYDVQPSMAEISSALQRHAGTRTAQLKGSVFAAIRRLEAGGKLRIVRENGVMRPGGIFVVEESARQN